MAKKMLDQQAALSFLVNSAAYHETEVNKIEYPEVQYPDLIPVDFSAPEWTKTVTYTSSDHVGKADWFHANARDVPRADVDHRKFETTVEMAAIGYGYNIEEISQAAQEGIQLTPEKAEAAKEAYEFFVDDVALRGNSDKNFFGLLDYPGITAIMAAQNGAGTSTTWRQKTPDEILADVNDALIRVWTVSGMTGLAGDILLPPEDFAYISTRRLDAHATTTILDWLLSKNIYTARTKQQLTITPVLGLETAGQGGSGRMIVYRKDPKVLKMHIPMRHQFLDAMRTGPLIYEVPGIFRLGGLDVKRPVYMLYVDGIS